MVVYNPKTVKSMPEHYPKPGSGLRWDEFVEALAASYSARFED